MTTETKLVRFDWAIKNLLRDKANFDVLEGFLAALLREEVQIIEILESESNQSEFEKKFNRVDILVKDQKQRQIIIEIQNHRETGYLERILWGASKLIVDNLQLGQDYRHVVKVISISILYFNFGLEEDYVCYGVNEIRGLHTNKRIVFRQTRKLETRYSKEVFPEYYLINVERFKDVINNDLDEWVYLLKHSALRADFKAKNIDTAREKLALLKMNREERQHYEDYLRDMAVEADVLETARTEGIQQGVQQGKNNQTVAIARNLLAKGLDVALIEEITGLSHEELVTLSQQA